AMAARIAQDAYEAMDILTIQIEDLLRDQAMIPEVQRLARHIHERYPQQAKALIERWMPETERYSNA
ncbi:hypothetical protein ACUOA8_51770, partial [Escherichia sp. SS-MK2]